MRCDDQAQVEERLMGLLKERKRQNKMMGTKTGGTMILIMASSKVQGKKKTLHLH